MRKDSKKPFIRKEDNDQHKINTKITAREIRLVVEGGEPQVLSLSDALKLAEEKLAELGTAWRTSWYYRSTEYWRTFYSDDSEYFPLSWCSL